MKWVPRDPNSIFLATSYGQKMPESSYSMYSSFFVLENIRYHHFTWNGPISQEIANLLQFSSGPRGPTIGTKFMISSEFGPLQVKWWCLMFSSMKKEEYMQSELSSIFVCKSCHQQYSAWVPGDPTPGCFCSVMSLFWKNTQIFSTKLLHLSVYPC